MIDATTLEEMARAYERGRQQLAAAERRVEELEGPYHAAYDEARRLRKALAAVELALATAKQRHAIVRALGEAGIGYDLPLSLHAPVYEGEHVYLLAAVGRDGTGLYVYTPARSRRYDSKTCAVLVSQGGEPTRGGWSSELKAVGLREWQERGSGPWGKGSGSMRPLAPPEGGRWRWLKLREQAALGVAGDE